MLGDVKLKVIRPISVLLLLPLILELSYFLFVLVAMPPLLIAMFAFPALYILPGTMLLMILRRGDNNTLQMIVEGFFLSTVLIVLSTSVMIALGLPLLPFNYSVIAISLVSILTILGFARKIETNLDKNDLLRLVLVFAVYVVLVSFLNTAPRLFTPDETTYISSARMGILSDVVHPMGVLPSKNELTALLGGRYFWIYLLISFVGSASLPAYQAGLIGAGFLVMIALASSLFVKNKWLSTFVFLAIAINPLLLAYSDLALNDLAISFYAVLAVLFFVRSFSRTDSSVSLNLGNLSLSLISIVVLMLIKPNLLVFGSMWLILVFVMFKYKIYKQDQKDKLLFVAILLPVLLYELAVDLPYIISVWVFPNRVIGDFFGRFLFTSPIEQFIGLFIAPYWNPASSTLFAHNLSGYIAHFWGILNPESSSLLVSAIILASPILVFSRELRKKLDWTILTSIVFLSFCLFYFEALNSSLSDASRFSLWMIPLWIPLAAMTLQTIYDSASFTKFFPVLVTAVVLIWSDIWLSEEKGSYHLYGQPSMTSADALLVQFMGMVVLISLLFFREDFSKLGAAVGTKLPTLMKMNLKKAVFCFLIILILLNSVHFASQFIGGSSFYESHNLVTMTNMLGSVANNGSLVFANNYISMRPYLTDERFEEGLLLPPPDTEAEFLDLLKVAPNNTVVLVNNDQAITWYEYANNYIKNYADADVIAAEKPSMISLANFNLSEGILQMSFDNANSSFVPDLSASENNGLNLGATVVEGYLGNALQFNGTGYVAIPNSDTLNIQNTIAISCLASIDKAAPNKGYMLLSKGYGELNGSYDIFVWDSRIYFELGGVNYLDFPIGEYLGEWHDFIFTYNGKVMTAFVDGIPVATQPATGMIRRSNYEVEIGRDGERESSYFFGKIDQLQISAKPLNATLLAETSQENYAIKTQELYGIYGNSTYFRIIHRNPINTKASVVVSGAKIAIDNNLTITLDVSTASDMAVNSTMLVATDRFTEVYSVNLPQGFGHIKFEYPYITNSSVQSAGGPYWLHLTQTRVILIVGGTVVFDGLVSLLNPALMNIYLMLITGIILILSLLVTFTNRNRFAYDRTARRGSLFRKSAVENVGDCEI